MSERAVLLLSCPDAKGLVACLASFVHGHGGNIVHSDHHSDHGQFLTRIEWELEGFELAGADIAARFRPLAEELGADWQIHHSGQRARVAIWVSKQDHGLLDLLWRQRAGDLRCDIPLVISNHESLRARCADFELDFHHLPMSAELKRQQEAAQLALLERYRIDLVVLAKYMQILSADFVVAAPPVINIHHSFLPAFAGARPYHRAHKRGVKLIGATAHYVTAELDAGPIIEQDVSRVSHRDEVRDLIRKGRDLERLVLARAVRHHVEHEVLAYKNRTVVFR